MKKSVLLSVMFLVIVFSGCTQNERAKKFGGTAEIELPKGKKLVNATWKSDNLWYLVRDMKPGETAETYEFSEESSFGILEGKYVIIEQN